MTTKKRSNKKTGTTKKSGGTGAAKSASKRRTEKTSPAATIESLARAAEALARAAEALVKAVNAHLGGGARSAVEFARTAAGEEPLQGNCIGLGTAGQIVENAINSNQFDIDKTLEQMGLISPEQRRVFKQNVLNNVRNRGCQINDGDVPNAADDTARTVRDTIQAAASK